MLSKKIRNTLHNVGTRLCYPEEFQEAEEILQDHNPDFRAAKTADRESKQRYLSELAVESRESFIEQNLSIGKSRKKARKALKEIKATDLSKAIAARVEFSKEAHQARPMFFHYHEYKKLHNKKTQSIYKMKILRATTCLLINAINGKIIAKGVALASGDDVPSKARGRLDAIERALEAAVEKITCGPIRREEVVKLLNSLDIESRIMASWTTKSTWRPDYGQLTTVEIDRYEAWKKVMIDKES